MTREGLVLAFIQATLVVSISSNSYGEFSCPEPQECTCDGGGRSPPTICEEYYNFPVSLRWLKSAQFAGFYAALANGFWERECLRVNLMTSNLATGSGINSEIVWNSTDQDGRRLARASIPWYS